MFMRLSPVLPRELTWVLQPVPLVATSVEHDDFRLECDADQIYFHSFGRRRLRDVIHDHVPTVTSLWLLSRVCHFEPEAARDCCRISTHSRLASLWMCCCSVESKLRLETGENLKRVVVVVVDDCDCPSGVLHSQTEISAGYSNRICTWWLLLSLFVQNGEMCALY